MQGNTGYGTNGFFGNGNGTGTPNNGWSNGWNGTGMNVQAPQPQTSVQPARQPDTKIIVNGRPGADAYPMPQGSTMVYLWDRNSERLFVKAYDNNGPCCQRNNPTLYDVKVNMNVALSEGATVDPIAVAISVDGAAYPLSEMDSTPAAVGDFNHIGTDLPLPILRNCCQSVAVQNISAQPIDIKNLIIAFGRNDLQ